MCLEIVRCATVFIGLEFEGTSKNARFIIQSIALEFTAQRSALEKKCLKGDFVSYTMSVIRQVVFQRSE